MRFILEVLLCVVCESVYFYNKDFTVSLDHSPLSKIALNDAEDVLYVGGKNIFLQLNFDLNEIQRQIIGPVNDSKNCKPLDTSCIYKDFVTTDNYISILKLYSKSFLIVCGTANQGLCFKYNPLNITENYHFSLTVDANRDNLYRNFLGSSNSSVMYITKSDDGYEMFYVGQSYDGRNLDYFYKEFAVLDLYTVGMRFDHFAAQSFQSICDSKKNDFRIKFLHIFESDGFIFYVFVRSANVTGSTVDTRISRLCKGQNSFKSYEEMTISCKSATITYNIGLSANFSNGKLYMSFGVGYQSRDFKVDDTHGSAVCVYYITQIKRSFDNDVLTECFRGRLHSPSWQCKQTACPDKRLSAEDYTITACNQTFMLNGMESNGEGLKTTSVFDISSELMTSVLPLEDHTVHIVVTGSNAGFVRKIQIVNGKGRQFSTVDVSESRNVPISSEMVLDKYKNLYILTGNKITKLSMTSCRLHLDCGKCVSSQDPLRCGWCFDHCSTKMECNPDLTWHNQSCPPFIYNINPTEGPIEGSTRLMIIGENFGNVSANASVNINNVVCVIQTINDTSISCLTGVTETPKSDLVEVHVTDTNSKEFRIDGRSEQKDVYFNYMVSNVTSFFPFKGPMSGNTLVTITGQNLHIGSSLSVMIGQVSCDVKSKSQNQIYCRTTSCKECPLIHGSDCQYTGELVVKLDGGSYRSSSNKSSFCYMQDPIVNNAKERYNTILSGGLNLIIHGDYFESVTNHSLRTDIQGKHVTTLCHVRDLGIKLVCPTPNLRPYINMTKESPPLTAQISLMLDDTSAFETNITVNHDPELHYLNKNSEVKDIDISDKILELQGTFLDSSLKKEDIILLVNETQCPVLELQRSFLRCNLSTLVHIKDVPLPVTASAGNWQEALGHIMFVHQEFKSNSSKIQLTTAGIVLGVFITMIFCLLVVMRKKHLGWFKKNDDVFSVEYRNTPENENFLPSPNGENASPRSPRYVREPPYPSPTVIIAIPRTGFDAIETTFMLKQQNIYIERDRLRLGQDIGHGNFGCVYKGYMLSNDEREILVAVKTILKTGAQDVNAFLDEAMIMKDFDHPNVLSLIGISVAPGEFPLVILPFMSNGDLLSYIRNEENKPTVKDLVRFGLDVARGMEYLGGIKFVHRDLAARNCMLDDNLKVKVADFGLARDIYTKNYYSSDNKKMLPVKWMAPESLENGTYSTQSDVWSFGVVAWELMTRGSAPYSVVDNWDMLKYLESGRRLTRPNFCPPLLYEIMLKCWEFEPENRPSFQEINERITELVE